MPYYAYYSILGYYAYYSILRLLFHTVPTIPYYAYYSILCLLFHTMPILFYTIPYYAYYSILCHTIAYSAYYSILCLLRLFYMHAIPHYAYYACLVLTPKNVGPNTPNSPEPITGHFFLVFFFFSFRNWWVDFWGFWAEIIKLKNFISVKFVCIHNILFTGLL